MAAVSTWGNDPLDAIETIEEDGSWVSCILLLSHEHQEMLIQPVLPARSTILSKHSFGASFWTRTVRINVRTQSTTKGETAEEKSYFMKLATSNHGLVMVRGECKSQQELYAISPNLVPKPIGYGTYHSNSNTHFFLCELVEMSVEQPEPSVFCEKVADLHRRSTTISPSGMFGFDITTCNGKVPQENTWSSSWESFFIRSLQQEFILEEQVQGPSEEISALTPILYEKVCPRLLRPLETEGRTLSPALLHGCLRPGFIGVHATNNQPCIFAASSFWGHNEYDIAIWRVARYHMRRFIKEYFKYFPCSPPTEDWDDRNLLYSLRADLHDSIMYPGTRRFRDLIIVTLKQLTKKFGMGYQGNATRKDCGSENLDPPAVSADVIDLEENHPSDAIPVTDIPRIVSEYEHNSRSYSLEHPKLHNNASSDPFSGL